MKPIRIFLVLLIVFLLFGISSYLLPDHDLVISKDLIIKLPSLKTVFQSQKIESADIASILEQKRSDTDSLVRIIKPESLKKPASANVKLVSQPLDYPDGDKTIL